MKSKSLLIIFILLLFGNSFGQITWVSRNLPVNESVRKIYFLDTNTGFACTQNSSLSYGSFYKTTNGGLNWFVNITGFAGVPSNIQFFDSVGGVVLGDRSVYKTTNRGVNWTYYSFSSPVFGTQCVNFYFMNSSKGVAFTRGGKEYYIIQTTNGGANWVRTFYSAGSTPGYGSFIFTDENTGMMLAGGTRKKTTNGGVNWSNFGSGLSYARDFYKYTNDIYFGVGYENNSRTYTKTTNGGLNWTYQNYSNMPAYHSIAFANQNTGFICGENGLLQYTTNQGTNWTDYNLGTTKNLNCIFFLNSTTGYIAGDSGKIFKTITTGGLTNITHYTSTPSNYLLEQNYPNPFNPSTAISYQLPADVYVSLIIYDINGKKIKQLVNEVQTAGNYTVTFDATGLSSGTYFCKLKSGKFIDVKKMVIIK